MVDSPCVAACQLNAEQHCVGCARHIDEIACWNRFSDRQKIAVLKFCQQRVEQGALAKTELTAVDAKQCQAAKARYAAGTAKIPTNQ